MPEREDSFERLFNEYKQRVFGLIIRVVQKQDDAEQAVRECKKLCLFYEKQQNMAIENRKQHAIFQTFLFSDSLLRPDPHDPNDQFISKAIWKLFT